MNDAEARSERMERFRAKKLAEYEEQKAKHGVDDKGRVLYPGWRYLNNGDDAARERIT